MSTSTDHIAAMNPTVERRFYPRVTPSAPIYVAFGPNNLGTLLNVSENGLLVATPSGLELNSVYRVFLTLNGAPSAITVSVRTIWTDKSQSTSGIQLLDLSEQHREQIREWVAAQTYRNEHLDDWATPKEQEPAQDNSAREANEPPPPPPPKVAGSREAESQNKPAFPPMPLPIHGEFTYEPPPDMPKEVIPVRRRKTAGRSNSRSSALSTILWTIIVAAACLGAAWSFRNNASLRDRVSNISNQFLHRHAQVASEGAPQADQSPSSVVSDGPTAPADQVPSPSGIRQGPNDGNASNTAPPTAAPKTLPPPVASSKQFEPTARATKPRSGTVPKRTAEPESSPAPRSYEAYSKAAESAPRPAPKNAVPVPAQAAEDLAAPAITAPVASSPAPAPPAPAAANIAAPSATSQPSTNPPPANNSVVNPHSGDISRRSAIAGSISNPARPGNFSASRPSNTAPIPAEPTAAASGAPRADSYSAPKPNPNNSAVIQMDVPEARVVEIKPPRSFTGSFTSSLVSLPGERVIRATSVTMHIQRSVRVPRERIPGERWLRRGHDKVAVGELSSRVDPQVPQTASSDGSIAIEASIDKDGYVTEVKPLYGSLALLPNVARAIQEWRYQPTYLNDKPVETQAKIEVDFHPAAARSR